MCISPEPSAEDGCLDIGCGNYSRKETKRNRPDLRLPPGRRPPAAVFPPLRDALPRRMIRPLRRSMSPSCSLATSIKRSPTRATYGVADDRERRNFEPVRALEASRRRSRPRRVRSTSSGVRVSGLGDLQHP